MRYFVLAPDGNQYGPADVATLAMWAKDNRLFPTSQLREEMSGNVVLASAVQGIFPQSATVAPPTGGYVSGFQPLQTSTVDYARPMAKSTGGEDNSEFVRSIIYSSLSIILALALGRIGLFISIFSLYYAIKCQADGHSKGVYAIILAVVALLIAVGLFAFKMRHALGG